MEKKAEDYYIEQFWLDFTAGTILNDTILYQKNTL